MRKQFALRMHRSLRALLQVLYPCLAQQHVTLRTGQLVGAKHLVYYVKACPKEVVRDLRDVFKGNTKF